MQQMTHFKVQIMINAHNPNKIEFVIVNEKNFNFVSIFWITPCRWK